MKLNNLTARAWTRLTRSTWITQNLLLHLKQQVFDIDICLLTHIKRNNKTMSTTLDENRIKLIELLTQEQQIVCDPLSNCDETLKACSVTARQFIGYGNIDNYNHQRVNTLKPCVNDTTTLLSGDLFYAELSRRKIDFILTEIIPYNFKTKPPNAYANYLHETLHHLKKAISALRYKGYVAVFTTDQRFGNQYYAPHTKLLPLLEDELVLQGIITIIQENKKLKSFGYPTAYVPNIIHQNVLILRKL